jgi:integrase
VAINRNLTLLRSCFNWAIHPGGYLTSTPFKIGPVTIVRRFPELARERRLEPGEEARLLAACGPHLRAMVEAALETACRLGELLSLQWRQVRWTQNEIHLPAGKTKSRRTRIVPISQRLHAMLEMRRHDPDGEVLGPDAYVFGNVLGERVKSIKTAWRLTCARAQITGLHFHDLRREAASRLLEGDVPEHYVQEVLGHANLSTTSRYLATTRQGLHQAMERYEQRVQTRANLSETRGSQRPSPAEERDTKAPETGLDRDPA